MRRAAAREHRVQTRTIGPVADHDQLRFGYALEHARHHTDHPIDALVAAQPADIEDRRCGGLYPRCVRDVIRRVIQATVDDLDAARRDPARDQIIARALGDHDEARAAIGEWNQLLERHHVRGDRNRGLAERRGSEQMRHDDRDARTGRPRDEARHLVHVLDHEVGSRIGELVTQHERHDEVEVPPRAAPHHAHSAMLGLARAARKPRGNPCDLMPAPHRFEQDLLQVELGAAGFGMRGVAEVHGDDVQRPARRRRRGIRRAVPFGRGRPGGRHHRLRPTVPIT